MTDYLREVEESMRAEKFARLWHEHGRLFILACVALVIGTAAQNAWVAYRDSQNEKATALMLNALKADDPTDQLLAIGKTGDSGDAALANLYAGNIFTQKSEWAAAISAYNNVIADKKAPDAYRDLATVQMVALQIDHDPKADANAMLTALTPISTSKTSAWVARATILSAVIKANKLHKYSDAVTTLKPLLADTNLPPEIAAQVSALSDVYAFKATK